MDLILVHFIQHRGPSHSLLFSLVLCLPFLVIYKKKAIPYVVALFSHSLIGDVFSGGVQLFWPFSPAWIFFSNISVRGTISVGLELVIFVVCTAVMFVNKDFQKLLFTNTKRVYLLIPFGAVLGPLLITAVPGYSLPPLLLVPSLFYLALFSIAIVKSNHRNEKKQEKT